MAPKNSRIAAHECLTDEALSHLKTYKYSSVDLSPLSHYVLRHYWNAVVEFLPMWLAPNMVTLIGFMFILGNVALMELFIPDLKGPGPSWVYWSFGLGVWMYSTMDNIDGKQARRTGTSSPLGELFDHGIDSLNCTLASLLETTAMGFGATPIGAFTALIPTLPMYFSTWETYHTHTLYLGYFNGPTEGLLIASLMMIASGIYGPQFWQTPIASQYPSVSMILGSTTSIRDLFVPIVFGTFLIAHLPACVHNVHKARKEKNLPTLPLLLEWIPIVVFTLSSMAWLGSSYSFLLKDNHLTLFCLTMSLVFGRMTTKIILAHLTRQAFPYWTVLLTPLVAGAIIVNLPILGIYPFFDNASELAYLRIYFVFAFIVYSRWAHLVITSICEYLGINALTIPREKWQSSGNGIIANGATNLPKKD
ncbi:Choline/ethanolaminephosphotransferase [Microthyrium microscopicum]|uniref:Choline/ethanolaminephosphotransferase n=1 Tax=Microthyrium microscopicum TaxID=703497 RepID=A0A6A6USJ4_9PEZI|nr:Choline/ethanolaminephosphotransferase [Microthyrium microscopicum]